MMTVSPQTSEPLPLRLIVGNIHDMDLRFLEGGEVELRTTGADPYVFTESSAQDIDAKQRHVLSFEYFSAQGTDQMQVFVLPPLSEAQSVSGEGLSRSEGWSSFAVDLKPALSMNGGKLRGLRLDFGTSAGKTIRLRNFRLRPPTEQELQIVARKAAHQEAEKRLDGRLRNYLQQNFSSHITQVAVGEEQIKIEGQVTGKSDAVYVAEAPLYADLTEPTKLSLSFLMPVKPDAKGHFAVAIERRQKEQDRLLSRWVLVRKIGEKVELLSHARYADSVQAKWNLPDVRPRNKKGIGAVWPGRPFSDLDELDLSAATINIMLNGLISTQPGQGRTPFTYGGRTWYADDGYTAQMDTALQEAAKRNLVVSAIVLVPQANNSADPAYGKLIAHPDADPAGIYVMPNLTSKEGLDAYVASLDFLAQRYSRPDNRYGRIHHWILHNEINAGWIWTNAGEKTALLYMDLYQKSMRIAHLIARQYNPHAKAFISLEHHWTLMPTPKFYAGRDMLNLLLDFSAAEGDFDWAIAFHPYPQNLFDPQVWKDTEVTFSFDTPKITFKNLEVLDAWVRQPRTFYLGKHRRTVHLTEQGLNSKDYSEAALRDQAAGMAYAWNKYKHLETIEVFDYHNWVDDRGEGGLRIGLRRFSDDKDDPKGKKPIWYVYQAFGTAREEEVTAPYKAVVGVKEWAEVRHSGEINGKSR